MGLFKKVGKFLSKPVKAAGSFLGGVTGLTQAKRAKELMKYAKGIQVPKQYTIDTELDKLDPETRELQLGALKQLSQVARGGFTAEDLANMRNQMSELQAAERGAREAQLSQLAQRGMLGGGAELAARIGAQQATQQAAAQRGLGLASIAQQRALQAMQMLPSLAGATRGQDIELARAKDVVQQFNKEAARRQFQDMLAKGQLMTTGTATANQGTQMMAENIARIASGLAGGAGL